MRKFHAIVGSRLGGADHVLKTQPRMDSDHGWMALHEYLSG